MYFVYDTHETNISFFFIMVKLHASRAHESQCFQLPNLLTMRYNVQAHLQPVSDRVAGRGGSHDSRPLGARESAVPENEIAWCPASSHSHQLRCSVADLLRSQGISDRSHFRRKPKGASAQSNRFLEAESGFDQ